MLDSWLPFDADYGICKVFFSESLGGWRQILDDGSHESVTEGEMKNFRLFPNRPQSYISERYVVDILLKQLDLCGVEDINSEMMVAIRSLSVSIYISREFKPVTIGMEITREYKEVHLHIGRLDADDEMINEVMMNFADTPSLKYSMTILVKVLKLLNINYEFKQLSGKGIFDIKKL